MLDSYANEKIKVCVCEWMWVGRGNISNFPVVLTGNRIYTDYKCPDYKRTTVPLIEFPTISELLYRL